MLINYNQIASRLEQWFQYQNKINVNEEMFFFFQILEILIKTRGAKDHIYTFGLL